MDNSKDIVLAVDLNLFEAFWEAYGSNIPLKKEFIKKIFIEVDTKYKKFISETSIQSIMVKNLSVYDICVYICEEHIFNLQFVKKEDIENLENNPDYIKELVYLVYDKLIFNDYDNLIGKSLRSKYSVEISSLNMFINRLFTLFYSLKIETTKDKLLMDIFTKCLLLIKSTLNQLTSGLETEAMSSWRTLHELECVLKVIYNSNEEVSKAYFRHLEYGSYHRNEITDEAKIAEIEENMKKDMEALQVSKSNKEKFINYGWLHWVSKTINDESIKFNFLGGLQKLAGLTSYRKWYEIASDVTHSTPLLVYANKQYLYNATIVITYESFFRIETLFFNYAKEHLKEPKYLENYLQFKRMYKNRLEVIYSCLKSVKR